MTSTALQPNLMNVSMTFTLYSAPHIRTTPPSALFWPRISTAVPYSGFTIDEYTYALTASTAIRGPIPNLLLT